MTQNPSDDSSKVPQELDELAQQCVARHSTDGDNYFRNKIMPGLGAELSARPETLERFGFILGLLAGIAGYTISRKFLTSDLFFTLYATVVDVVRGLAPNSTAKEKALPHENNPPTR